MYNFQEHLKIIFELDLIAYLEHNLSYESAKKSFIFDKIVFPSSKRYLGHMTSFITDRFLIHLVQCKKRHPILDAHSVNQHP